LDMMRRTRRVRDYPPMAWVNPDLCLHPAPVTLLKFNEADETLLRCGVFDVDANGFNHDPP
jgi:hypothetical protein